MGLNVFIMRLKLIHQIHHLIPCYIFGACHHTDREEYHLNVFIWQQNKQNLDQKNLNNIIHVKI